MCDQYMSQHTLLSGGIAMAGIRLRGWLIVVVLLASLTAPLFSLVPSTFDDLMDTGGPGGGPGGNVGPAADTDSPVFKRIFHEPMYPGIKTKVNVTALLEDSSQPVNVSVKYGFDQTNWTNLTTVNITTNGTFNDRNPSSGTVRGTTLSKTYTYTGYLIFLYVYCYSSDSDTLSVNVEGYNPTNSTWERIFYQYSFAPGTGAKVNKEFKDPRFTRWRISYADYENNDNIYYNCTYKVGSPVTVNVPASGDKSKVYVQFVATDNANNSGKKVYSYNIDRTKPKVTDLTTINYTWRHPSRFSVYTNVTDNNYVESAVLNWSLDNSTWSQTPMGYISGGNASKRYVANLTAPSTNSTVYYRVEVYDMGGSHGNSTTVNLTWDPPPTFSNITNTPDMYINNRTTVLVKALVEDDDTISQVWINYSAKSVTWTRINATKNGSYYEATVPAVKGSNYVHFRFFANDTLGGVNNTTAYSYEIDETVPTMVSQSRGMKIPGPKTTVPVMGLFTDKNEPLNMTVQYGYDNKTWTNLTTTIVTGERSYDDRNPTSGFGYGTTLSKTYLLSGRLTFLYVYCYSGDSDTLYVLVEGYNNVTGLWERIFYQYSFSPGSGTKVNEHFLTESYTRWRISYRDYENNDNIYYNCTYRVMETGPGALIPPAGTNTKVYYRFVVTDMANNTLITPSFSYLIDSSLPRVIDDSVPMGVWRGINDYNVYANASDDKYLGELYLNWSTDNSTWNVVRMTKVSGDVDSGNFHGVLPYPTPAKNTTYYVTIEAHDYPDNIGKSKFYTFYWNPPPWINAVSYLPAHPNNQTTVNITSEVWDDDGVDRVYVNYTADGSTWSFVNATKVNGNWSAVVPKVKGTHWVTYVVFGVDADTGENRSVSLKYHLDEVLPTVHTPFTEPYYPNASVATWLLANITDFVGIDNVSLHYRVGTTGSFTEVNYTQASDADSLTVGGYVRSLSSTYFADLSKVGGLLGTWNSTVSGYGGTPSAALWTSVDCIMLDGAGASFSYTQALDAARSGKFVVTNQYTWNSVRSSMGNPSYSWHRSDGFTSYGFAVGRGTVVYTALYNSNYLGYSYGRYSDAIQANLVAHLKEVHSVFMPYGFKIAKTTTSSTVYYKFAGKDLSNNSFYTGMYNFTTDGVMPKVTAAGGAPVPPLLTRTQTHLVWINITDEVYIGGANVVYSLNNGTSWSSRALSRYTGNNTVAQWRNSIPATGINCWVWFYYDVYDRAGNFIRYPATSNYSYRVSDIPVFVDVSHTPAKAHATSNITVYANVTDLDGISRVVLAYRVGSGSDTTENMTQGTGNQWYLTFDSPGVTGTLSYHMRAYEALGLYVNSSTYSLVVDASPPILSLTDHYPMYPNTTMAITVNGTASDEESSIVVYIDWKYGAAGNITTVTAADVMVTANDRNPSSGYGYGTTLSKTYNLGGRLQFLYVYCYSSDSDTLYVNIEGYKTSTSSWERIYYQNSYSPGSGVKVNANLFSRGYTQWRISYRDYENNDNIYYNCTYKYIGTKFSTTVPAPGYSTWIYYRLRAIDEVGNANNTTWGGIWADGVIPQLDAHKPTSIRDAFTDVNLFARFVDEGRMEWAQMWYKYEGDWTYLNMTATTFNGTHLGANGIINATGIPMNVSYYFKFWDAAGNGNQTKVFTYTTKMRNLVEGVFENFDSSMLTAPTGFIKWEWDFDYTGTFNADRTGKSVRYRYYDNGSYTIALRLTDNGGNVTKRTFNVMVMDKSPIAVMGGFTTIVEGKNVTIDGSLSSSWPDAITAYDWDMDYDGFNFTTTVSGKTVSYAFLRNGTRSIALRVTDDDGSIDVADIVITILDSKPTLVVDFPTEVDEGTKVIFNATGTVSFPDAIDRFEWDLDYNGTFQEDTTGDLVNHTYMDNGTYRFMVQVFDIDGSRVQLIGTIVVADLGPTALVRVLSLVDEGVSLDFDGNGSTSYPDEISSFEWDFYYNGTFNVDGTGPEVSHTYMDNGTYTIGLRITDDDGSVDITTMEINVSDLAPTSVIWGPDSVDEGSLFMTRANGSASYPDDIIRYEWDFFYDGISFNRSGLGMDINHTYMDDGTYTIALRVTDDDGTAVLSTHVVTVADLGPTADVTITGDFLEGTKLIMDARGTLSYPDEIVTYEWDFYYEEGEFDTNATGSTVEYTYLDNDTYTIAFRVTDDDGTQDLFVTTFDIMDQGPVAAITVSTFFHAEGSLVIFSAGSSSSFPDLLVAYHWDWEGDGETDETTTDINGKHAFTTPGKYEVVLTVEDDDGTLNATSVMITITDVGPTARFEVSPTPEGELALLNASGSMEPGEDFSFFRWDLDDDGDWDVEETCSTLEWVWLKPGRYGITLEVEDVDGSTDSYGTTLLINDVGPIANPGGPYEVDEGTPLTLVGIGSHEPGRNFTDFKWDPDGDGDWDLEGLEADVEWTYVLAGEYTARLFVMDEDDSFHEASVLVTVIDLDPVFDIVLPQDVKENVPAVFTLENLADPGTDEFIVTWGFADGSTADGITVNHTFLEQGSYRGQVTVEDNDGNVYTVPWQSTLEVANSPPVVELSDYRLKATEDTKFVLSVYGQDTANDTVSYTLEGPGGKIDPATGLFKWTPLDEHVGNNRFTFIATDEDGGVGTYEAIIVVEDVDNDFLGMSTAAGIGLIIAMFVTLLLVGLYIARSRGIIGGGSDEDLIEPDDRPDLDGEVEVDLAEQAAEAEAPPAETEAPPVESGDEPEV
jgi:PKD repeat protein